jgi:hypothetical protein
MISASLLFFLLSFNINKHDVRFRRCNECLYSFIANHSNKTENEDTSSSRWQRRTAKRRQRTEELLHSIEIGGLPLLPSISSFPTVQGITPTLKIPSSSIINWDAIHPYLDPMQGGKLNHNENGSADIQYKPNRRGIRKRGQVQAFHFILSSILNAYYAKSSQSYGSGVTIIDAGCGAGNLAIALAGLLQLSNNNANSANEMTLNILAVDVNNEALHRLSQRVAQSQSIAENTQQLLPSKTTLTTCCADLANYEYINSQIPPHHDVIVVSLHACGAASDMAMNLAYQCNNAPFVVCPCCTAKSLTKRDVDLVSNGDVGNDSTDKQDKQQQRQFIVNPQASHHRSGATSDIQYPRSNWLKTKLSLTTDRDDPPVPMESKYTTLAKVADVGLGPQTPTQQREQQRNAKRIIEYDRLMSASERQYGYDTRLMRIDDQDEDPRVYSYGKGEVLLGALKESLAANVLLRLPSS